MAHLQDEGGLVHLGLASFMLLIVFTKVWSKRDEVQQYQEKETPCNTLARKSAAADQFGRGLPPVIVCRDVHIFIFRVSLEAVREVLWKASIRARRGLVRVTLKGRVGEVVLDSDQSSIRHTFHGDEVALWSTRELENASHLTQINLVFPSSCV